MRLVKDKWTGLYIALFYSTQALKAFYTTCLIKRFTQDFFYASVFLSRSNEYIQEQ